jgi:hypothetical protein
VTANFTTPETAIKAWFLACTGLSQVLMQNEPRPFTKNVWGEITIGRSTREGQDSVINQGASNLPRTRSVRSLQVTLAVESFSQSPSSIGLVHLETLRSAALWPKRVAILTAAKLVYANDGDIVQADRMVDERFISRYELDARFRWGFFVDATEDDDAVATIETVEGTGTLNPGASEIVRDFTATKP